MMKKIFSSIFDVLQRHLPDAYAETLTWNLLEYGILDPKSFALNVHDYVPDYFDETKAKSITIEVMDSVIDDMTQAIKNSVKGTCSQL